MFLPRFSFTKQVQSSVSAVDTHLPKGSANLVYSGQVGLPFLEADLVVEPLMAVVDEVYIIVVVEIRRR